jgi:hypothetical protein
MTYSLDLYPMQIRLGTSSMSMNLGPLPLFRQGSVEYVLPGLSLVNAF